MKDWKDILYEKYKDEPQTGIFKTTKEMNAKEQAKELVEKCKNSAMGITYYQAKQCALICVDELQKSHLERFYDYYEEVKQEIEKL